LAQASSDKSRLAEQEAKMRQLRRRVPETEARAQQPVVVDPAKQRQFAAGASAVGLNLRQTEAEAAFTFFRILRTNRL
jgi:hypothetical protein